MKKSLIYSGWYLLIPGITTLLLFYSQKGKSGGDMAFLLFSIAGSLLYHAILIVTLRLEKRVVCSILSFSATGISSWLMANS